MNQLVAKFRARASAVPRLRSRLIRAAQRLRSARPPLAMGEVLQKLPRELTGGDLLDVLRKPLEALADAPQPAAAEESRSRMGRHDRLPEPAGRHAAYLPAGAPAGARPRRFAETPGHAKSNPPHEAMVSPAQALSSSAPGATSVRTPASSSRARLAAAIDRYWTPANSAAPPAAGSVTPRRDRVDGDGRAPAPAAQRPVLPADQLALRMREFDNSRADTFGARHSEFPTVNSLTTSRGAPGFAPGQTFGELAEPASDLADHIAGLLRDQAIAHGIDVT